MRRLLYILTILPLWTNGQTFTLTDTTFKSGGIFISYKIFFDFGKFQLRPESVLYLDTVADFLKKNKGLVIEVGNHTDTRANPQYNSKLTYQRAKVVVDCLVSKGIKPDRLSFKGFGETKPLIADNEIKKLKTKEEIEKAHQTNRRTEFKILRTDYKSAIVYTIDFDYLEGCETGKGDCKPVTIIRQTTLDSVTLIFPSGGTQTNVYLYTDSAFQIWSQEKKLKEKPDALRHDKIFSGQGSPTLDLTGLPDGKYRPYMLGCGLGGGFELTIVTKK